MPIDTYVIVFVPPVHCGNWNNAAFTAVLPETVQPTLVRTTATRAYDVYVASLVV